MTSKSIKTLVLESGHVAEVERYVIESERYADAFEGLLYRVWYKRKSGTHVTVGFNIWDDHTFTFSINGPKRRGPR